MNASNEHWEKQVEILRTANTILHNSCVELRESNKLLSEKNKSLNDNVLEISGQIEGLKREKENLEYRLRTVYETSSYNPKGLNTATKSKLEQDNEELKAALAEIHEETGRGPGESSIKATKDCIISSILDDKIHINGLEKLLGNSNEIDYDEYHNSELAPEGYANEIYKIEQALANKGYSCFDILRDELLPLSEVINTEVLNSSEISNIRIFFDNHSETMKIALKDRIAHNGFDKDTVKALKDLETTVQYENGK